MAVTFDTRCLDLAEELLDDVPGVTRDDIHRLASDFLDAFKGAADRIQGREGEAVK